MDDRFSTGDVELRGGGTCGTGGGMLEIEDVRTGFLGIRGTGGGWNGVEIPSDVECIDGKDCRVGGGGGGGGRREMGEITESSSSDGVWSSRMADASAYPKSNGKRSPGTLGFGTGGGEAGENEETE
jgi:hypothetical protein